MSEDGYLSKDATLSYSGNQLSTMFVYNYDRHRGNTVDFVYSAGRLVYLEEQNMGRVNVQYDGNNPTRIGDSHDGISLTWLNGTICQVRSFGNDINANIIEYDNGYNPLNEVLAIFFPNWNRNMNNPKKVYSDDEMVNVIYEYNGNWPSIATATKDGRFIRVYFEYTDGTGAVAPVNFKNRTKNDPKRSLSMLPSALMNL